MASVERKRKRRVKWEIDFAIHRILQSIRNPGTHRAFRDLVRRARTVGDLLRPTPLGGKPGWARASFYLEGLLALAESHRHWIRQPESWAPSDRRPPLQFGSLARCLLANHPVPRFMTLVWFEEPSRETNRRRKWFRHLGLGNNIRGTDVPVSLTKKTARRFLEAPDHSTVTEALRWAVREPEPSRNSHCPAAPSKRRRKRQAAQAARGWTSNTWKGAPIANFTYVEPKEDQWSFRYWTIQQLHSQSELIAEGESLHHCVATYDEFCERGISSIWSLKCSGSRTDRRMLTIEVDPKSRRIVEALGKCNRYPTEEARRV
ncbi:MAG: PcfJ domain-containing protein, partial [Planctomycetales bacterium]